MGGSNSSSQGNASMNNSSGAGVNSGINGGVNMGQNGQFGYNNSGNFGFNVGSGSSSGGSSSQSASQDDVWDKQSPFLTDMYGQAQDAFNTTMEEIQGLTPEMTAQVQDAFAQGMGGFGNALQGGFAAQMRDNVGPNTYTDALKGDIVTDAGKLKQQTLGTLDARAAAAGMSGSSGYRDQVADSFNNIDQNAQSQMNQLGFNSFNQGIQNQLALTGQMDQNAMNAMGMTGAMQQAAMAQANPAMLQQQLAQNYANTIGGPTVLNAASSSSSSSNESQQNSFGMNNGFANGMNLGFGNTLGFNAGVNGGANVNNGWGTSTGSGSSSGWNITPPNVSITG